MSGPYIFGLAYVGMLRRRRRQEPGRPRVRAPAVVPKRRSSTRWRPAPTAGRQARGDAEAGRRRATPWRPQRVRRVEPLPRVRLTPRPAALAACGAEGGAATRTSASRSAAPTISSACASPFVGDTDADTDQIADAFVAVGRGAPGRRRDVEAGRRPGRSSPRATRVPRPHPSEATLDAAVTLLVDRNDLALELLGAAAATAASLGARPTAWPPTRRWSRSSTGEVHRRPAGPVLRAWSRARCSPAVA